jgi:hypothetical protein
MKNKWGIISKDEFDSLFKNLDGGRDYSNVKDTLQQKLGDYFNQLSDDDSAIKEIKERLYKMIDYAVKRYDDYSSQRHRFLVLGVSLIGASATLIGILLSNRFSIPGIAFWLEGIGLLILGFSGAWMIHIYSIYITPEYPYRKIMDIHSWYFKYNFSDSLDYKLSSDSQTANTQVKEVAEQYLGIVESWMEKAHTKNYFLKEDIEQVVILQLLQKYGRDSLEKMKNAMLLGLVCFFLCFIGGIFGALLDILCNK